MVAEFVVDSLRIEPIRNMLKFYLVIMAGTALLPQLTIEKEKMFFKRLTRNTNKKYYERREFLQKLN